MNNRLIMLWNGSGKPIKHMISFWLWGKAIETVFLAEPEEGCLRRKKRFSNDFVIKNIPKPVFMFRKYF